MLLLLSAALVPSGSPQHITLCTLVSLAQVFHQMLFLAQPSQLIWAWDEHYNHINLCTLVAETINGPS